MLVYLCGASVGLTSVLLWFSGSALGPGATIPIRWSDLDFEWTLARYLDWVLSTRSRQFIGRFVGRFTATAPPVVCRVSCLDIACGASRQSNNYWVVHWLGCLSDCLDAPAGGRSTVSSEIGSCARFNFWRTKYGGLSDKLSRRSRLSRLVDIKKRISIDLSRHLVYILSGQSRQIL